MASFGEWMAVRMGVQSGDSGRLQRRFTASYRPSDGFRLRQEDISCEHFVCRRHLYSLTEVYWLWRFLQKQNN